MQIIEIKTLVDITNTKVTRLNQGTQLELDQCRNFITLLQCVELRSIVSYDSSPQHEAVDVKGMGLKDAIYLLENRGLKVITEGYGAVKYQSIIAGSSVVRGTYIVIKLGT